MKNEKEMTRMIGAASSGSMSMNKIAIAFEKSIIDELRRSLQRLGESLSGAKLDTLILLIITSTIIPLFQSLKISPIIGFLMTGTIFGPTVGAF